MNGKDEKTGQFTKGNHFWQARSSHGRNPIFKTGEQLRDACLEYFEWVEANPLYEEKVFNGKDGIVRANIAKMRAMTVTGLCLFLDISFETWCEWKKSRPDLSEIIRAVEATIYQQKFTGAAADLLNASIIARDLGLAEKNEHSGPNGGAIEVSDGRERLAHLISKHAKPGPDNKGD